MLYKNLKKYYYIEHDVVGFDKENNPQMEYTVWYARFVTIPFMRWRFTVIYGLDYKIFVSKKAAFEALEFMLEQKMLYKLAVKNRYKK